MALRPDLAIGLPFRLTGTGISEKDNAPRHEVVPRAVAQVGQTVSEI